MIMISSLRLILSNPAPFLVFLLLRRYIDGLYVHPGDIAVAPAELIKITIASASSPFYRFIYMTFTAVFSCIVKIVSMA